MQNRNLGPLSLRVPPLCLGGNVFGWTAPEATSFAVLDAAAGAGLNFIDTADMYSVWVSGHRGGESETVVETVEARHKPQGHRDRDQGRHGDVARSQGPVSRP